MTTLERKMKRRKIPRAKIGEMVHTTTFAVEDEAGLHGFYWCVQPDGMDEQQAFNKQPLHGPFKTELQVQEDQRTTLFGKKCKVVDGGLMHPTPKRPQ